MIRIKKRKKRDYINIYDLSLENWTLDTGYKYILIKLFTNEIIYL